MQRSAKPRMHPRRHRLADAALTSSLRMATALGGVYGARIGGWISERVPPSIYPDGERLVTRRGLRWRLDPEDQLQRAMWYSGTHEEPIIRTITRSLRKDDVFLDVGANIGLISLAAAQRLRALGGGRVVAFEPGRDAFAKLIAHVEMNGLQQFVDPVNLALGAERTDLALRRDLRSEAANLATRSLFASGEPVEVVHVVTCDEWVRERGVERVDVVKIDVEGAEFDVISGMRDTLSMLRPRIVVAEVIPDLLERAGTSVAQVFDLVRSLGYETYWLRARYWAISKGIRRVSPRVAPGPNAVFVPVDRAAARPASDALDASRRP